MPFCAQILDAALFLPGVSAPVTADFSWDAQADVVPGAKAVPAGLRRRLSPLGKAAAEALFSLERRTPVRNFSKGMKRQAFAALALACRPKYLLLDEAFDGLDPLARLELKRGIISLEGTTAVISSHSLRELEDICSGFALLDGGAVADAGDLAETLAQVHKFQAAFDEPVPRERFPFECLSFESEGRVVRFVVRGEREEIVSALKALSPIFVEEIKVDFEELFLCEVRSRGYLS